MNCTHGSTAHKRPGDKCAYCGSVLTADDIVVAAPHGAARVAQVADGGASLAPVVSLGHGIARLDGSAPPPHPVGSTSAPEVAADRKDAAGSSLPGFTASGAMSLFDRPEEINAYPAETEAAVRAVRHTRAAEGHETGQPAGDGEPTERPGALRGEGRDSDSHRGSADRVPPATPLARATDPATAHAAAASITADKQLDSHQLVLRLLAEHGPLSDFDLARLASAVRGHTVKQTSLGVRRHELVRAGLVCEHDRGGVSDTGSPCIRWALVAREVAA